MKIHYANITIGLAGGAVAGLLIGATALSTTTTHIKTVAGPTVVKTQKVYSGVKRVTVKVPGPTVTRTAYVPATQGPTGTEVARYSGTGNQVTGSFDVPATGDYIVKWDYSGNTDCSSGSCMASNFIVTLTGSGEGDGLPNAIAESGSGSTEVSDDSGTESLNVQAIGSWTLEVISAS